ncbi:MAG TPA: D-arabinono-1,4-lactone oxidase [Acidimicrobiales bacterium]|nr:D-arabinono-1,4-lactone oxidase [Acidimicrobiales bacterium]
MARWSNWAGNQSADGVTVVNPRSTEEVAEAVRRAAGAKQRVKPIGAGHSFTAIGRPEGTQLVLDNLTGLRSVDRASGAVTVEAGTRLHRLNELLAGEGLAMTNLGDIDVQTIAGAVSTGTHGTGSRFGGIATQVVGLEIVAADGSVLTCSPTQRPDLWSAARVGLGALGVITAITLQTVPLFALRAEEGPMPLDELLSRFDELAEEYDHFEAYWFPHTTSTLTKRNTRRPLQQGLEPLPKWKEWLDDEFLSNTVFGWTIAAGRRRASLIRPANRIASKALGSRTFTDLSYKVFTSPRRVRFCEMEYAIPREVAIQAITEVVSAVDSSGMNISFPVELRVAAGDDIPLSTASGRDSAYIAFHVPAGVDHRDYFALVGRILDGYSGRPHWGKLHTLDAETLRQRYPRFDEFVAIRDSLDPTGVFTNSYLDTVLGSPPDGTASG